MLWATQALSVRTVLLLTMYMKLLLRKRYMKQLPEVWWTLFTGYNATIFAYGQTGTGKTYTMEGFNEGASTAEKRGIIPRAIEQIFGHIQRHASPNMRFLVRASYLQIYNEQISTF